MLIENKFIHQNPDLIPEVFQRKSHAFNYVVWSNLIEVSYTYWESLK